MRNAVLKNRGIYFCINTLVMLSFLRTNFSLTNLGIFVIVVGLALYFSVFQSKDNEPACIFLPVLLFSDIFLYFALQRLALQENFSSDFFCVPSKMVIIAAIGGIVLLLAGIGPSRRWAGWFGNLLFGAALIAAFWANGNLNLLALRQPPAFKVLLTLHVLMATLWFFCVQISDRAAVDGGHFNVVRRNSWLTAILLCLLVAANLFEQNWIISMIDQWEKAIYSLPADLLVWWKVLIAILAISVCAAALCDFKDKSIGTDAYVMISFVGAIVLIIVLYNCFFPLKWMLLLVYAQLVISPIEAFAKGLTRFRLRYEKYLAAVLLLSLLGTAFLQYSLWLNLLITAAVITAIYHLSRTGLREQHSRLLWSSAILSIAAECAGLLMANRWHMANFILLALATAMALATILILNMPHPANKCPSLVLECAVCASFALICTVLVLRHGVQIDLRCDELTAQIELEAAPRGKDNEIVSLQYSWSELGQESPAAPTQLRGTKETLAIEGNRLTVEAVDRYGVRTTRTFWYLRHGIV